MRPRRRFRSPSNTARPSSRRRATTWRRRCRKGSGSREIRVARQVVDWGVASPVGVPPHGAVVDETRWQTKAAIDLPSGEEVGGVAYLPLEGIDAWGGVRVVDAASREVPFLFEQTVHHARESVVPAVVESAGRTAVTLSSLAALRELDAIELTATAPDYFTAPSPSSRRSATPADPSASARLAAGPGSAVRASLRPRCGSRSRPPRSRRLSSARQRRQPSAHARQGDDRAERSPDRLRLREGRLPVPSPREPRGNLPDLRPVPPCRRAPRLAGPTRDLEPARDLAPAHPPPAKWFWVAVIVAGLGVAAALARALRTAKAE